MSSRAIVARPGGLCQARAVGGVTHDPLMELHDPLMEPLHAQRLLSSERRGSSWPVLVETERGLRLVKLRGAAQGTGALVAEMVVAHLAEALGLRVPARCLVSFDRLLRPPDGDIELSELLARSRGLNLGFAYLPKARPLEVRDVGGVSPDTAAAIVWLDALTENPDRTAHNPNLLWSDATLWLIDHGAALRFQYDWSEVVESAPLRPAKGLDSHVLRRRVRDLAEWDDVLAGQLTREVLEGALAAVPDDFLSPLLPAGRSDGRAALDRRRAGFVAYRWERRQAPRTFWAAAAPQ